MRPLLLSDLWAGPLATLGHWRRMRWSRERLLAYQAARFRRLARYVYERSPYYREVMRERGLSPETCRPEDFPVLRKEDVLAHFDDLVTDRRLTARRVADFLDRSRDGRELLDGRWHVLHTSGSSGQIGCFVYSRAEWSEGSTVIMRQSTPRVGKRVAFVGATRGHFAGVSLLLSGNRGANRLFHRVRAFDIGEPLSRLAAQLNEFQPHTLTGYASALRALAEAQEEGRLRIRPRELGNGGEPAAPEARAAIERAFGVPLGNVYASSEHLVMGLSLGDAERLHLMEDLLQFEFRANHACVTNLYNFTTPLIRYRMEDVLEPCADEFERWPFRTVRPLVGRSADNLEFVNRRGERDFISGIVIVELRIRGLAAWQVALHGAASFTFRACYEPGLTPSERSAVRGAIRARLQALLDEKEFTGVTFEIRDAAALPPDPQTGKFRLVVAEIPVAA